MTENTKLELTWIGKNKPIIVEPRILIENIKMSNNKEDTNNMLIHGDNLLALKALENIHGGEIKCIYIDPPYNTGAAFELYDDNLEHSIWLNLMKERLIILKNLLTENGIIYVQIDKTEQAYLKVLMDEIFGRKNFITMITCKVTSPALTLSCKAALSGVSSLVVSL
jgi:adenine-specific DNA-methyltransferase